MMPFATFEQTAGQIPYQSPSGQSRFLYALVRWLRPKSVVEVGSHIGASAVWLARALQENGDGGVLTCIDNFCWTEHTQREQWEQSMRECGIEWGCQSDHIPGMLVRLIVGRSQEVEWPAAVDFAYVDGNHCYPVVKHDVEKAIGLGATLLAMHDTVSWEGSRRYAEEFRTLPGWDILEENGDCGLMVCKKRQPKGPCQGGDQGEIWDRPSNTAPPG